VSDERKVAVIGAGGWGRNHVRTWHSLGALAVVCDPDPARRAEVESSYEGVEVVADIGDVLGKPDIAGIVLATPAPTHAPLAITALHAGHDVLVEKPLALDLADAEHVVATAERLGRVLSVGHVLEYHPAVRALDGLLTSGALGELRWMVSHRLNLGRVRTAEDVLWSFSPHDIALLLRFAGAEPESVSSRGGAYLTPGIADVVFCGLRFPGGVEGEIIASWLHPFKEQRLVVVGSERMAVFDDTRPLAEKLVLQPYTIGFSDDREPTSIPGPPEPVELTDVQALTEECRDFLARINDRGRPLTDGRAALQVLRVLDAANRSEAGGGVPTTLSSTGPQL
jgi:UDP-2-acetamido-3-amino-2,3-dideoxy-glucuronate N-acetyltransferase